MAKNLNSPKSYKFLLFLSILLLPLAGVVFTLQGKSTSPEKIEPVNWKVAYGQLPLSFERNKGQSHSQVKFLSRVGKSTFFFTPQETFFRFQNSPSQSTSIKMQFTGAQPSPPLEGLSPLSGKHNYFIGNDPKKWLTNVPLYSQVKYENLYPGIDLVYYGNQNRLEFDFVLQPGARPETIQMSYQGMKKMELDPKGNLVLHTPTGSLIHQKPIVYQERDGQRKTIEGNYVLKGKSEVGFEVAAYDRSRPLVIDPVLSYSTFLGGSGGDDGGAIAVDSGGNAYITGNAFSASVDFPLTPGVVDNIHAGTSEAYVTKLNPTGTALVYSTFLGGSNSDQGIGIAVDSTGNAYVTGQTGSNNFPFTVGAFDTTFGGPIADAFVAKLNPTGTALVYSTYLGGSNDAAFEAAKGIAIDNSGNAYVGGFTTATNFPTMAPIQPDQPGEDGFVTKLNPAGTALVYSTYLGGGGTDDVNGIAVDAGGNAVVTGNTGSANFPISNQFQTDQAGQDAFITKINPAGSAYIYSTYLGGNGFDMGFDITVDSGGNAYATGQASSTDFPTTPGVFDPTCGDGGFASVYVAKFNPTGGQVYTTCLGGNTAFQTGRSIGVDGAGNAYVTGMTLSTNFPTTPGALDATCGTDGACNGGAQDLYLTKFNSTASALLYSTYFGGSGDESMNNGKMLGVDPAGNAYITGNTSSADFPTTPGAFDTTLTGTSDAFASKFVSNADFTIAKTDSPDPVAPGGSVTYTLTVTNGGPDGAGGVTVTDTLPAGAAFVSASPAACTHAAGVVTCNLGDFLPGAPPVTITIVVTAPTSAGTLTNTATVTANEADPTTPNTATATTAVQSSTTPPPTTPTGGVTGGGCSLKKTP